MTGTPRVLVVFVLGFACAVAAAAQAQGEALACTADTPVVEAGGSVTLRAWTEDAGARITWQVSAGTLEKGAGPGKQRQVVWRLPGRAGRFTAAAASSSSAPLAPPCSLSVFVVASDSRATQPPPPASAAGQRETGTMLLVKGQPEPAGYGLYSYFLLGAPPDNAHRPALRPPGALGHPDGGDVRDRGAHRPAFTTTRAIARLRSAGDAVSASRIVEPV